MEEERLNKLMRDFHNHGIQSLTSWLYATLPAEIAGTEAFKRGLEQAQECAKKDIEIFIR